MLNLTAATDNRSGKSPQVATQDEVSGSRVFLAEIGGMIQTQFYGQVAPVPIIETDPYIDLWFSAEWKRRQEIPELDWHGE